MTPDRVEVHIESLVVHGWSPAVATTVAHAVEHELGRLARDTVSRPGAWHAAAVPGGNATVQPGRSPGEHGRRAARAIWAQVHAAGAR